MASTKGGLWKGIDVEKYYTDIPKSNMPAQDLLATARLKLLTDFPFFGKICQNMVMVEDSNIPTTAVDRKGRLYYNRRWVNCFDMTTAIFMFAHEANHIIQRCFARAGNSRQWMVWNKAADMVGDTILIEAGIKQCEISKLILTDKDMEKVREIGLTIERVYKHLLQEVQDHTDCAGCKEMIKRMRDKSQKQDDEARRETEKQARKAREKAEGKGGEDQSDEGQGESGEGADGEGCSHEHGEGDGCGGNDSTMPPHTCGNGWGCTSASTTDLDKNDVSPADDQEWREKLAAAKQFAQSRGNMPGAYSDLIDSLFKTKTRWQDYLKTSAIKVFGRARFTYKRINRRGPAIGLRLQGIDPDAKCGVVVADTSGSMSHDACKLALSESASIMKLCGTNKIWLILHDYEVYYSGWVDEKSLKNMRLKRGGTSHAGVFAALDRTHEKPEFNFPKNEKVGIAIMFTDLGTSFPLEHPSYDVLWAVPEGGLPGFAADVPFGRKILVQMPEGAEE